MVVVVEIDQLAEPQVPGQRGGFRRDAFHQVAVADDAVSVMVDDLEAGAVVARRQMRLGHRHAHAVAEALAKRPGRHLDAGCEAALGVPGRDASPLAELLDLLQRQIVPGQMEQAVQQHRAVAGGQDKAVAVEPRRVRRVVLEKARPQHVRHGRGAQRQARMAAVGLLHGVDRKEAQGIYAQRVEFGSRLHGRGWSAQSDCSQAPRGQNRHGA